ncbi:MAG: hypothetical protein ACJ752_14115 [Gaiellaceae bacterium]
MAACLEARPEAAIAVGAGIHIRAEVVVRNLLPQALGNLEASQRLAHLRERRSDVATRIEEYVG